MGFMDKLKGAAGSAIKGAVTMSATKYGIVVNGRYKGCTVSMNAGGDTLVFIKIAKEEGRHIIKNDVKTFEFVSTSNSTYKLTIVFNDGNKSEISLSERNIDVKGDASSQLAAEYKRIADILSRPAHDVNEISDTTKHNANLIMRYAKYPEL